MIPTYFSACSAHELTTTRAHRPFFSALALVTLALITASSAISRADSCIPAGDPLYSAVFSIPLKPDEKYRITIADKVQPKPESGVRIRKKSRKMPTARITHDTRGCVAQCEFKSLEPTWEGHADHPHQGQKMALDLLCKSALGLPLSSQATLIWTQGNRGATLRFGSWLNGYSESPLQVELDRFLNPPLTIANAR